MPLKYNTLREAIIAELNEFSNNSSKFSIHDITKYIRQKVNSGFIEIEGIKKPLGADNFDYIVNHSEVKSEFDDIYRNYVSYTFQRNFNGMYFEYTVTNSNVPAFIPPPVIVPSVHRTNCMPSPGGSNNPTPRMLTPEVVIKDRIVRYLKNLKNKKIPSVTIKKIQSAIKRGPSSTGYSYKKIEEIVNKLGYYNHNNYIPLF